MIHRRCSCFVANCHCHLLLTNAVHRSGGYVLERRRAALIQVNPTSVLLGAARAVAIGGESAPLSEEAAGAITWLAVLGLGCEAADGPGPSMAEDLAAALSNPGL